MYCDVGLPPQDLAQSPIVAGVAGQTGRLLEVGASDLGVEGRGATARDERLDQQTGVADLSVRSPRSLGVLHAPWGSHRCGERAAMASHRPRVSRGRHIRRALDGSGSTAMIQDKASWTRPLVHHSRCRAHARRSAPSPSPVSRLHVNAARRLSISMSARSTYWR